MSKGLKATLVAVVCSAVSYAVTRPLARAAGRSMIERFRSGQAASDDADVDLNTPQPLIIEVADDGTSSRNWDEPVEYETEIDSETGVEYVRLKIAPKHLERIATISQGNLIDVRGHIAPTGKTVVEFTAKW